MGSGGITRTRAARVAAKVFSEHGFSVTLADSPWTLGGPHLALHGQLIDGIGEAAQEMGHAKAADWIRTRRNVLARSTATIGHTDLLAIPRRLI